MEAMLRGGVVDLRGEVVASPSELRLVCQDNRRLVVRNARFEVPVSFEGFAAVELCDVCFVLEDGPGPALLLDHCRRSVLRRVNITGRTAQSLLECRGSPRATRLCGLSMFGCSLRGPGAAAVLRHLQCVRVFSLDAAGGLGIDAGSCSNCAIDGFRGLCRFRACKNCVLYDGGDGGASSDSEVYVCHDGNLSLMASSRTAGAVPTVSDA